MKRLKRGDLAWYIANTNNKKTMVMITECRYKTDVYLCAPVAVAHHASWVSGFRLERVVP